MFYTGLYRENMKTILVSKTTRHSALIFGMQHQQAGFYQICSNITPGYKNGPAPRSHMSYIGLYRVNVKQEKYNMIYNVILCGFMDVRYMLGELYHSTRVIWKVLSMAS